MGVCVASDVTKGEAAADAAACVGASWRSEIVVSTGEHGVVASESIGVVVGGVLVLGHLHA
jgi:hypothetical protein